MSQEMLTPDHSGDKVLTDTPVQIEKDKLQEAEIYIAAVMNQLTPLTTVILSPWLCRYSREKVETALKQDID